MRAAVIVLLAATACSRLIGLEDVQPPDFTIRISPSILELRPGELATFTVDTARTAGIAEDLVLLVDGLPAGMRAELSRDSMTAGSSATLIVGVPAGWLASSIPFTVTAVGESQIHGAGATLAVIEPDEHAIALTPGARALAAGASASFLVTTTVTSGRAQLVTLSASGLPAGVSGSFQPPTVMAGGSSTFTVVAGAEVAAFEDETFVVGGTAPSFSSSATGRLTVSNDFGLTVEPPIAITGAGGSASYTVRGLRLAGPAQEITLAVVDLPAGIGVSLAPGSIRGDGTATVTLSVGAGFGPTPATIPFTIRGQGASAVRTAAATLNVRGPLLVNGDFETGDLRGWTFEGGVAIDGWAAHAGGWSVLVGTDFRRSILAQHIEVPAEGRTTLTAWINAYCDGSTDWQELAIRDESGGWLWWTPGCQTTFGWVPVIVDLTPYAGTTVILQVEVEDLLDEGYTSLWIDDVTVTNQ